MKTRIISAVVALLILIAVFYFFRQDGLFFAVAVVGFGCVYEYSRLTFAKLDVPKHLRIVFWVLSAIVLLATAFTDMYAMPALAIASVCFFTMSLLTIDSSAELPIVLQLCSFACLGFVYTGVFSGMVMKILGLPNGIVWLFGLLAIVFAGDTLAYLTGRFFGKTKLLEPVSPKKTIEGSMGGLVGSAIAGFVLGKFFLNQLPLPWLVLTALATGAFAQVGDLVESLLKRVADVKDSGSIMPGHGGMLDRVDGVIFAAPVYYALALYLARSLA